VRSARALSVLLLLTIVVAACANSTATPKPSDAPSAQSPVSEAPATAESATPELETIEPATPEPATPEPATGQPTSEAEPTDAPPGAAACTGTDENVAFFAEFADVVDWKVYCPVLPKGWFVGTGQWRQADGGRLEISYRGPRGAGLMLQEGSFCPGDSDCVPTGEDVGPAAFGDMEGTLVRTDDGWAVVVDRGEKPSWLLTVTGVSEDAARAIAADMVMVGG
jgi:hypothetical protein